jgi:branched-chain amino acid transport system permease protein
MNAQIALILGQDGVANGAVYALLALSILLVFSVTRALFIPQGEFVVYGALSMAAMQAGKPGGLVWLLAAFALAEVAADAMARIKRGDAPLTRTLAAKAAYPFLLAALLHMLPLAALPMGLQALLTLAVIVPMGPLLYRLFYQPIAEAPTLILLIVSIAVHLALVGLGLLAFGPEGARAAPFNDANLALGVVNIASQTLWIVAVAVVLMLALYRFFDRTVYGKALRAVAINRAGAQLVGISPRLAGRAVFALAAFIGAASGILVGPAATLYYDSGFLISLKGFVGAIIGGLTSYPLAAAGAVVVGLLESFSSFWASAYKEIIVFTLIIPVLLWRSLQTHAIEEEDE